MHVWFVFAKFRFLELAWFHFINSFDLLKIIVSILYFRQLVNEPDLQKIRWFLHDFDT